jgi:hypothetical protein
MEPAISTGDRNVHIQSVIKSNLISFGLTTEQIDKITTELTADILDILENIDLANAPKEPELDEEDEDVD